MRRGGVPVPRHRQPAHVPPRRLGVAVKQLEQPVPISVLIRVAVSLPAAPRHLRHLRLRRVQAQQRARLHPPQQLHQ